MKPRQVCLVLYDVSDALGDPLARVVCEYSAMKSHPHTLEEQISRVHSAPQCLNSSILTLVLGITSQGTSLGRQSQISDLFEVAPHAHLGI